MREEELSKFVILQLSFTVFKDVLECKEVGYFSRRECRATDKVTLQDEFKCKVAETCRVELSKSVIRRLVQSGKRSSKFLSDECAEVLPA